LEEKELVEMLTKRWEAEWKEKKNERVATLHNRIVDVIAEEKANVDEVIIALEIAHLEALEEKMKMIRKP